MHHLGSPALLWREPAGSPARSPGHCTASCRNQTSPRASEILRTERPGEVQHTGPVIPTPHDAMRVQTTLLPRRVSGTVAFINIRFRMHIPHLRLQASSTGAARAEPRGDVESQPWFAATAPTCGVDGPGHPLAASAGFPSAVTLDSTSRSELPLISYVPSPVLGKQILIT